MKMDKIENVVNRLRKNRYATLSTPLKKEDFLAIKDMMEEEGFPTIEDGMFELFRFLDGIAYNGVELFCCYPGALREGNYSLPDIISSNREFREYYSRHEEYKDSFLYIGRTDEDLVLFDAENGKYLICAREDLMVYEETDNFADLVQMVFNGRL